MTSQNRNKYLKWRRPIKQFSNLNKFLNVQSNLIYFASNCMICEDPVSDMYTLSLYRLCLKAYIHMKMQGTVFTLKIRTPVLRII